MRTSIDIDDTLMDRAMVSAGLDTKKATVEEALRRMVRRQDRLDTLSELSGLGWEGDLDELREVRTFKR